MFKKFRKKYSEKELRIIAVIIAMVLSGVMVAANIGLYRGYRISLIESEKDELFTMARSIGRGLEQYVEQELNKTDLCFDSLENILEGVSTEPAETANGNAVTIQVIRKAAEKVLGETGSLYRSCVCMQEEGTGLLDTYVWDDPDLNPVQRIVAYTTIDIRGERWIVNSTRPYSELSEPLRQMFTMMALLTVLYLIGIGLILVFSTSAIGRMEHQRKEISYLKEINRGMEAIALKNDEIRHYQRVQSMGMMSSHIAHEFNNYLTPVMVYGELLEDDETISEENRAMLREMLESVSRAAKLSRELLDFSRMDAGAKTAPIDLTAETQEAVSIVRQLAPAKISFAAELDNQPAWIRGREGMMQHILMNLCKNAFHAMEDTERKELRVSYVIESAMDAETAGQSTDEAGQKAGRTAVLTVSDTGCGIKADNRKDIFEPFYTTKGSRQGTGLGLSVVRSMVENAGGTIFVESEEGKGTTFTMRFPTTETREEQLGSSDRKEGDALKVLCVCRSKKVLKLWREWLDSLDGAIEYTSHEASVVARLSEDKDFCDLLITENELETMSGIDLAQIVKRANPAIRVCLLTQEGSERQQWYLNNGILDEIRTVDQV